MITMPVGRIQSLASIRKAGQGAIIAVALQHDSKVEDPALADLRSIAVLARVHRIKHLDDGSAQVMVEGLHRVEIRDLAHDEGLILTSSPAKEFKDDESTILATALEGHVTELAGDHGGSLAEALRTPTAPGLLADRIAAALDLSPAHEIELLLTLSVSERLRLVARRVNEAKALHEVRQKIEGEVRRSLSDHQKEALLRERMRAIQKELGEGDEKKDRASELRARLDAKALPDEVRELVATEFRRLENTPSNHPENGIITNYLELVADLPFEERATSSAGLETISERLDSDHHGLDEVKRRILEHMAVLELSGKPRGAVLALSGPPGVGKTSLGQSIADATGRPFVRIALGGVRDEAEVRGHRRTYVGAIPGRVIQALRKVKVKNPVILLDEIDKLGQGWAGDPEAALLELLDPEQNKFFTDHYLEFPFDLSEVLFVATANDVSRLSPPLRDRLELVELSGYTPQEKEAIGRKHLVEKQRAANALTPSAVSLSDSALRRIVADYTREAGVRQLEREIGKLMRAVALEVARAPDRKAPRTRIDADMLEDYLGRPRFFSEVAEQNAMPGVATGLAWTPVGGEILFVETSRMPGKGSLQTTGQLGGVMEESMRAALTYVRSHASALGIDPDTLERSDLHIHVPAGAVPKDGPSAGVTIFTALCSLLTGHKVRSDVAMTGEATLRGRVLPVGGIAAKVLAAHRAGIPKVILPARNRRDIEDIPSSVRDEIDIIFAEDMSEVLEHALDRTPPEARRIPPVSAQPDLGTQLDGAP
jgi:ATP-dependent Lon protease